MYGHGFMASWLVWASCGGEVSEAEQQDERPAGRLGHGGAGGVRLEGALWPAGAAEEAAAGAGRVLVERKEATWKK